MSLTESKIEAVSDGLKRAGFNLPDDMDNDEIAKIVGAILEALNIEWVN